MLQPIASADVRWLSETEGGRRSLPPGPTYAATAAFGDADSPVVSIVLWYEEGSASTTEPISVRIGFLVPELVNDLLAPGVVFVVKEGARRVADGVVTGLG